MQRGIESVTYLSKSLRTLDLEKNPDIIENKKEEVAPKPENLIILESNVAKILLKVKGREGKQRLLENIFRRLESVTGCKSNLIKDKKND